jgi:hypothetical protein
MLNFWMKKRDRMTYMTDKGNIVVLKKGGHHQEFYAVKDPAYNFTDKRVVAPLIPGQIGERFRQLSEQTTGAWNIKSEINIPSGAPSEEAVENMHDIHQHWEKWTGAKVIDLDNEVVISDGTQMEVKLSRVNKYVLIAVEK